VNILRTHHVAIICSDYGTSKAFYTQTLGLEIVSEVHRSERNSSFDGSEPSRSLRCLGLRRPGAFRL